MLNAKKKAFNDKFTTISKTMDEMKLPTILKQRVDQYFFYIWHLKGHFETERLTDFMNTLNVPLSQEVQIVCHKLVRDIPLFFGLSGNVIKDILNRLQEEIFLPGDYVFSYGDEADKLYIIVSGVLEMMNSAGKCVVKLSDGNYLGELGLIMQNDRSLGAKCGTYTILQSLSNLSFNEVRDKYPHLNNKFIRSALENYKFEGSAKKKRTTKVTKNLLESGLVRTGSERVGFIKNPMVGEDEDEDEDEGEGEGEGEGEDEDEDEDEGEDEEKEKERQLIDKTNEIADAFVLERKLKEQQFKNGGRKAAGAGGGGGAPRGDGEGGGGGERAIQREDGKEFKEAEM